MENYQRPSVIERIEHTKEPRAVLVGEVYNEVVNSY